MNTFGNNLRVARERAELSQREVAERVGISQGVYAQYETAAKAPNINLAAKIADTLNVTLDELVKDGVCNDA